MNSAQILGRLTKEPSARQTANGKSVSGFTVAIDRGGDRGTDFIPITVFGAQADACNKYLVKGQQVAVEGRIQTGSYKNKDGQTVYTTDVIAHHVEFLSKPKQGGDAPQSAPQYDDVPEGFTATEEDIPF